MYGWNLCYVFLVKIRLRSRIQNHPILAYTFLLSSGYCQIKSVFRNDRFGNVLCMSILWMIPLYQYPLNLTTVIMLLVSSHRVCFRILCGFMICRRSNAICDVIRCFDGDVVWSDVMRWDGMWDDDVMLWDVIWCDAMWCDLM